MKLPKLNNKGAELSLNVVIIVILALIVLIVVALFFTGGLAKLFGKEAMVSTLQIDPQIQSLIIATCELKCAQGDTDWYNQPEWSETIKKELENAGKPNANCGDLVGEPCR